LLTQEQVERFNDSTPAWRDEIWTDAAIDILIHHTPNLLLFHLLQTDTLQHQYGPMTSAAYAAYAYADTRWLDWWTQCGLRACSIASHSSSPPTMDSAA
jgi:predicted AlkP superfamily pyrophosphatase or phosphodiesterase